MPTVIDELTVEVGLDRAKFVEGRRALDDEISKGRKTLETFGKNVEEQGQKISEVFAFVKRGAVGILGAFIGGEAANFIDRVATMDAHTGRLARSIGATTKELGAWQNMMRSVGGTAEDANALFSTLNDTFMGIRMGNRMPPAPLAALLSRSGINPQSNITESDALQQIIRFLSTQTPQQQRFWLKEGLGASENQIFLMMEFMRDPTNAANLKKMLEAFTPKPEDIERAQELQRQTSILMAALDNLARVGFPALTFIVNRLVDILGTFTSTGQKEPGDTKITGPERSFWNWYNNLMGKPPLAESDGPRGGARGDRNNNPGNIEYGAFARAHGATGSDGRFAIFPDWNTGASAMAALLQERYQGMTLSGIQQRWTNASDKDYLESMSAATGMRPGDIPNLSDPDVVKKLMRGMIRGEGSHIPPANKTSSMIINGGITVVSNKAEPKAVADQIPDAMRRYAMLGGINSGLT
jgi:hypothetical protein